MKREISFIFILLAIPSESPASNRSLEFRLYRGYLIVAKCSVAHASDLTAIIDTGTTESILDLGVVRRLSLQNWPDSATSLTTDTSARGVSIPELQLGPLRIKKLEGIAMDLALVGRELGIRADVVIGMDVLHRANFVIDYQANVITFGPSPVMAHGASLAPGLRFALIDSNVLGRPLRLQVDTGFNGLLVYGNRVEGLAQPVDTGARIAGVAQASSVRSVDSLRVQVGNWHASHVIVSVMDGAPRDFDGFDGLLGPRLLGKRRVAFDFDHRMLYWD